MSPELKERAAKADAVVALGLSTVIILVAVSRFAGFPSAGEDYLLVPYMTLMAVLYLVARGLMYFALKD